MSSSRATAVAARARSGCGPRAHPAGSPADPSASPLSAALPVPASARVCAGAPAGSAGLQPAPHSAACTASAAPKAGSPPSAASSWQSASNLLLSAGCAVSCQFLHAQKVRTEREECCAACKQKNVRRRLHHRGGLGKTEGAAFLLSTLSRDSRNSQPPHSQKQTSSAEAEVRSENPDIGDSQQVCERAASLQSTHTF